MDLIDVVGLDEEIRCEMCRNPLHTNRGCDGHCKYDEKLYERIIQILDKRITPLPPAQPEPCDDPRADIYYLAEKIGIHRLYALVVELRGEPEPCEDTISRQQTITALRALSDEDGYINVPHEVVTDVVRGLPPVKVKHEQTTQPEQTKTDKLGVKTGKTCEDCISRQAAIDALDCINGTEEVLRSLPSAQPEIIRCGQCKYAEVADPEDDQDGYTCQFHRGSIWFSGSYCSWAERREDG